MKAAVADLVPSPRRGTGYGLFGTSYGIAWLGGVIIGALLARSPTAVVAFTLAVQACALATFLPLLRHRPHQA